MKKLKLLSLFAGIGGFELGLERSGGFETVAQCEIEEFPRKILAKHWPKVKRYEDVRTLNATTLQRDGIAIDAICGGFPCQDISTAGKGEGIEGERSGLWTEYARLIGELRPKLVFVENVAALLGRGLDKVLGDLAALGYDAEWHCIPASAVGAPHRRDRLWIVAYTTGERRFEEGGGFSRSSKRFAGSSSTSKTVSDSASERSSQSWKSFIGVRGAPAKTWQTDYSFDALGRGVKPTIRRGDNGFSERSHRLKALGNAVVPQIPELLGRATMEGMPELWK